VKRNTAIEVRDGVFLRHGGGGDAPVLWCVHGYGESGLSFEPLTATPLCDAFRLVIPDLPGFGVSSVGPEAGTLDGQARRLAALIRAVTPEQPVGLIGHSLGASIAALAVEELKDQVAGLFAIEGNLTAAGGYFTGRAAKAKDAAGYKRTFLSDVGMRAARDVALRRYLASVTFADDETFWLLGRDATARAENDGLGELYRRILCPTLYFWGRRTTMKEDRDYLAAHDLPNRVYTKAGHWPMIDIPDATGRAIAGFFDQPKFRGES